jgi:hypothetical protein
MSSRRRHASPKFKPFSLATPPSASSSASASPSPTSVGPTLAVPRFSFTPLKPRAASSKPISLRIPEDCDDDDFDDANDCATGDNSFNIKPAAFKMKPTRRGWNVQQAVAPAAFPIERLFHAGNDEFAHEPSAGSVELLLSLPQSCFEHIGSFCDSAGKRALKLVCRRFLGHFQKLRIHWVADNADKSIIAQRARLSTLVRLNLSDTTITAKGLAVIAESATSLCFLDLSSCILLNDASTTLSLLATATRLRMIDLCGTAVAPPSDAICHLTAITRLSRLSVSGCADVTVDEAAASRLPSLASVVRLLDACADLRVQFLGSAPVFETAAPALPTPSTQQTSLDAINANGRISFVLCSALCTPRKTWPVCRAPGCFDMPYYLIKTNPETGNALECDSCGAKPQPSGPDFLFCKRHSTFCPPCYEATAHN